MIWAAWFAQQDLQNFRKLLILRKTEGLILEKKQEVVAELQRIWEKKELQKSFENEKGRPYLLEGPNIIWIGSRSDSGADDLINDLIWWTARMTRTWILQKCGSIWEALDRWKIKS